MQINRVWAMPSSQTFSIPEIKTFVLKYIYGNKVIADPFSGFSCFTEYSNDLNTQTPAKNHKRADDFLQELLNNNIEPHIVLFDPPYSIRQVKECYSNYGLEWTNNDNQNVIRWTKERDLIAQIKPEIVLSFGWSSSCMGKKRGYEIEEILLVSHGSAHNDTICVAEKRT